MIARGQRHGLCNAQVARLGPMDAGVLDLDNHERIGRAVGDVAELGCLACFEDRALARHKQVVGLSRWRIHARGIVEHR